MAPTDPLRRLLTIVRGGRGCGCEEILIGQPGIENIMMEMFLV